MEGSKFEVRDFYDNLMQNICYLCHHPFQVVDYEELEDLFCSRCKVINVLEILKKEAMNLNGI